jgi:hypothetical protein
MRMVQMYVHDVAGYALLPDAAALGMSRGVPVVKCLACCNVVQPMTAGI